MGETKLIQIVLLSALCQITLARPFTFPDGSRTNGDRNGSPRSVQLPEPEGRSIRGDYSQDKRLDIYSRYNVYEHEEDDYRRTTTTFRPYVTIGTTRQTFNRHPNANYNRLPPAKNDEPIEAETEAEDDYEDDGDAEDGVDPPPSNAAEDFSSSSTSGSKPVTFNNLLFTNSNNKFGGFSNLFGEDRRKHKYKFKRRRPGQPCIPYDLFNRLRTGRDSNGNRIDPKTLIPPLNFVLADVNYYSPSNNYNGHGVASDTGAYDTGTSGGGAVFNNHFYDAVGGYPCTGGYRPQRPHGGPLGFFGQGGLFDWTSSADSVQSDPGEGGSSNKPAVVFNLNDAIDTVATNWRPGESFQMMMKVIAEFISSVAGGGGGGIPVVGDAVDTVRQVNKEFVSLFN